MAKRPNVLLIHGDQHRRDCLGAYGNTAIRTPNLDRIASDGVTHTNHYCSFPVCTPSRYSLISGLYVRQHMGWSNHCTLPNGIPTFPRVLREAGYQTSAVGKMHYTPTYLDVGFEDMVLAEQNGVGRYDDDYHRWLSSEGLCPCVDLMDQEREFRGQASDEYWNTLGAMVSDLDEEHHSTTWVGDRALERLEGWGDGGNLLMVGFVKPHHPFDPPSPWDALYSPADIELLDGWLEEPLERDMAYGRGYFANDGFNHSAARLVTAMYYATISQIDHHVGRMIDCLKTKGIYDNTLIIYTSDHGEYLGFHHLMLKSNLMYDPLVGIPLIIKPAGQAHSGSSTDALSSNIDLAPTILRATGCRVPCTMFGIDLSSPENGRDFVFSEQGHGRDCMVRSRYGKLISCPEKGSLLFFDLEKDPLEMVDESRNPAYTDAIAKHERALCDWALREAITPVHLDEMAPIITRTNVPVRGGEHRDELKAFFQGKMREYGCPPKKA